LIRESANWYVTTASISAGRTSATAGDSAIGLELTEWTLTESPTIDLVRSQRSTWLPQHYHHEAPQHFDVGTAGLARALPIFGNSQQAQPCCKFAGLDDASVTDDLGF